MNDFDKAVVIALGVIFLIVFVLRYVRRRPRSRSADFQVHHVGTLSVTPPNWDTLTRREKQCAIYAARGMRNADIAAELNLSQHTVESHIKHAYAKLDVHTRVELTNLLRDVGMDD